MLASDSYGAEIAYSFSHVAGTVGGGGKDDGLGSTARFAGPSSTAVDSAGNVYVADTLNHSIRKVSPAGQVSTFAGVSGFSGSADGQGSTAFFNQPYNIAVDASGSVYVADTGNYTVRKITSAGVVTTIAGTAGQYGSADGTGAAARFWFLSSIAVDKTGTLYVMDGFALRTISPSGVVTTVAGDSHQYGNDDGVGPTARFSSPAGLAVDSVGNIFVADFNGRTIRKVTSGGVVTTFAGAADETGLIDGTGATARFNAPAGIAVDNADNLYVVDYIGSIRKITPARVVTTFAGLMPGDLFTTGSADGIAGAARFLQPRGISIDAQNYLYVTDSGNHTVRKISPTAAVTTLAGLAPLSGTADGAATLARFKHPRGVVAGQDGNVYVSDYENQTIRKVGPNGSTTTLAGDPAIYWGGSKNGPGGSANFYNPWGLAMDSGGNLFVADSDNHTVRKITPAGLVSTYVGTPLQPGTTDGALANAQLWSPTDVAFDQAGNLYVAGNGLRKITPAGVVSTVASTAFDAIAVDTADNVFGVSQSNAAIWKVSSTGTVSIVAGDQYQYGFVDSVSTAARFSGPRGIAIDSQGNLFVADTGNSAIRRITPAGVVTTVAGQGVIGSADGIGADARFDNPVGIDVDQNGTLYVVDSNNHCLRKGVPVVINRTAPAISWAAPTTISYGTALSATQLNATANVSGTFTYDPPVGTILTAGTHTLTVTFTPTDTFNYSVASTQVTLSVAAPVSRLANIAARGYCSTEARVMIGGFVIGGTTTKRVLVRAIGPSLVSRGLNAADVLVDPMIEVHRGEPVIATNDNWGDNANVAQMNTTAAQIGAAALDASDSKSSALLLELQPGAYTFVARGKNDASGIVLLEVFGAEPSSGDAKLVNIATRAYSKSGDGVTIGGFVISGNTRKQVLLRGVGPTLTNFGISQTDALADPGIELHDANHGNVIIGTNDNWNDNTNAAAITSAGVRIGASPIDSSDAKTSALLLTLDPGAYTFIASGKSNTSGIVLVEIYDAD